MDTLSANEAKTQFGDLLLRVQRGPVLINKNGKPAAVMISAEEYERLELLKRQVLQSRARQARADIVAGNLTDGEAFFDDLEAGRLD
jgi:prevent-host-death family protein